MKLILISIYLVFLISCGSTASLKPANSNENTLKEISKDDLEDRKEQVEQEIQSASVLNLSANAITLNKQEDPFFENLKQNESISIFRPAKQLTVYETVDVWTVQIASFTEETNAQKLKSELDSKYKFLVRIPVESSVYKVRIGAYQNRNEADQLLFDLKKEGYGSAWVTKDKIKKAVETVAKPIDNKSFFYLQIGNYSSELYAQKFEKEFHEKSQQDVFIKRVNGFYKVLVGKVSDRNQLDALKLELSRIGYQSFVVEL